MQTVRILSHTSVSLQPDHDIGRSRDLLRWQLSQMHAAFHTGIGVEIEHLLADCVGIWCIRRKAEASATAIRDARVKIPRDIAYVVHGVMGNRCTSTGVSA